MHRPDRTLLCSADPTWGKPLDQKGRGADCVVARMATGDEVSPQSLWCHGLRRLVSRG